MKCRAAALANVTVPAFGGTECNLACSSAHWVRVSSLSSRQQPGPDPVPRVPHPSDGRFKVSRTSRQKPIRVTTAATSEAEAAAVEKFEPPFFVVDDDVHSFDSLYDLVTYVEPWSIEARTRAFDSRGRRLLLVVRSVEHGRWWKVDIDAVLVDVDSSGQDDEAASAQLLREYLAKVGSDRAGVSEKEAQTLALPALVPLAHRWSNCS